jgi:hypothetical protein
LWGFKKTSSVGRSFDFGIADLEAREEKYRKEREKKREISTREENVCCERHKMRWQ